MWLKISWSFPLTFFPPLGFDKLPDFFFLVISSRGNLGKNLFLIKLKIWERNFVFPLILANDVFEMFQSGIFFHSGGVKSFKNKLRNFWRIWIGIGIGHFLSWESFFIFLSFSLLVGEKRGYWRKSPNASYWKRRRDFVGFFKVLLDRIHKKMWEFWVKISREKLCLIAYVKWDFWVSDFVSVDLGRKN